jgi:aminoacyl tRNA synthase complex-interacting multifunctional protein 1
MSKSSLELLNDLIAELENSVKAAPEVEVVKKQQKQAAKPKKDEAKTAPVAAASSSSGSADALTINSIELRVGIIRKVSRHETADKLYCEEIDIGEEAPRAIASGLVPYYTLEGMQDRKLIVVCNLKPRNLVGFKSNGMVLCASKVAEDGTNLVEFVDPPAHSKPGDRIVATGIDVTEPLSASKCDKTKAFQVVAPDLKVDENGIANWKGFKLVCLGSDMPEDQCYCIAPTLRDAIVA